MKPQIVGKLVPISLLILCLAALLAVPWMRGVSAGGASVGKAKDAPQSKLVAGAVPVQPEAKGYQTATFAGGCFWARQTEFAQLKGVKSVIAGYSGGTVAEPTYEQVCTGATGHAEAIQIVFDPTVISYADLVRIFLADIDPTTLNRQGPDEGTQYRSAIFYHDEAQRTTTQKIVQEFTEKKVYPNPIVTEVVSYKKFYPAEDYHQDYYLTHPTQPYCATVVAHEVQRFQEMNRDRLKP